MTTAHQYINRISLLIILSFFIVDSCLATIGAASATGNNIPQAKQLHSGAEQKPDRAWMAAIQDDIRHREYFFSSSGTQSGQVNGNIWQAPNRRQNVRIHADKNGIELRERRGAGKQLLHLRTVALGRVDLLRPLQTGHISAHDNRLEIQRHGLSEWYVNTDKGIEQGFTVSERPQGTQALVLEIECDSQPVLFSDTHLLFNSGGARPLDYGKLDVLDAKGKNIPSRFALLADNHFGIEMEDQDALYPLTIDPIITSSFDTLLHGDQTNEYFGTSVADAGDVNGDGFADILIGAMQYDHGETDEGAAFLYLGNSNGRSVRTSFVRSDGSHPIASRGLSYDENGFGLRMDLHSPRAGEMIRIEALVCPEIQPLPGVFSTCETFVSPWQDSTPAYTLNMAGLTPGLYFIQARLAYAPYGAVNQRIYQQAHHCPANFPCLSSSRSLAVSACRFLQISCQDRSAEIKVPLAHVPAGDHLRSKLMPHNINS